MTFRISWDDDDLKKYLSETVSHAQDLTPALQKFQFYHFQVTLETFMALALGGDYRGVHWDYFRNPWYVRKTDGQEVPPWGGVPTLRGTGVVPGRRRPSGARLREGDAILQDTRRLLREVTGHPSINQLGPKTAFWGTLLPYAAKQEEQRPYLFMTSEDGEKASALIAAYLLGES